MSQFYDIHAGEWLGEDEYLRRKAGRAPVSVRSDLACPHYAGDIEPYMSPLGTGEITSRSHRREELKRHGCREVDPSERPKSNGLTKRARRHLERQGIKT